LGGRPDPPYHHSAKLQGKGAGTRRRQEHRLLRTREALPEPLGGS
jgi:hypothetical protein